MVNEGQTSLTAEVFLGLCVVSQSLQPSKVSIELHPVCSPVSVLRKNFTVEVKIVFCKVILVH